MRRCLNNRLLSLYHNGWIKQEGQVDISADLPELIPDHEHRNDPFPLNSIQQAYWLGRESTFELGQVACQSYIEFDQPADQLNIRRFEQAWQGVIARHEMLHTLIYPDGTQQILTEVPTFSLPVTDLRDLDE